MRLQVLLPQEDHRHGLRVFGVPLHLLLSLPILRHMRVSHHHHSSVLECSIHTEAYCTVLMCAGPQCQSFHSLPAAPCFGSTGGDRLRDVRAVCAGPDAFLLVRPCCHDRTVLYCAYLSPCCAGPPSPLSQRSSLPSRSFEASHDTTAYCTTGLWRPRLIAYCCNIVQSKLTHVHYCALQHPNNRHQWCNRGCLKRQERKQCRHCRRKPPTMILNSKSKEHQ